jgi:hypothetical protein
LIASNDNNLSQHFKSPRRNEPCRIDANRTDRLLPPSRTAHNCFDHPTSNPNRKKEDRLEQKQNKQHGQQF